MGNIFSDYEMSNVLNNIASNEEFLNDPIKLEVPHTSKFITGYWENWKQPISPGSGSSHDPEFYMTDINNFNHVYYSFLTLD